MVEPPVAPAVNGIESVLSPATIDPSTGAAGVAGVVTLASAEAAPPPLAVTARIAIR
jgi:hypothetical protein